MLQNYLKSAIRSLLKNKGITAINIAGLSIGLACFCIVLLHVLDEFSFERMHEKADRIYRVYIHIGEGLSGEPETKSPYLPMPLGPAIQADFPDVVRYSRFRGYGDSFVRTYNGVTNERIEFADTAFFSIFSFPMLYGNAAEALSEPGKVVLVEKVALRLFGESNPVGKILEIKLEDQFEPFTVSAVAKNLPSNSTCQFEILLPFSKYATTTSGKRNENRWQSSSMMTFVELRPGSGLATNDAQMLQFRLKYFPDEEKEYRSKGLWSKAGAPITYGLQPLPTLHNDTSVEGAAGNPKQTMILLGIGIMILLIACINFTTLAIGRSAGRAREIGVRKVIGAGRQQLSGQFLTESVVLSGLSAGLGMAFAGILLPAFNQVSGKTLSFNFEQFPELWWLLPGVVALTGLLAGIYPAFVLSGFSPLETLKSKFKVGGENWFTRSLVTFQFVLSVGLIGCTFVMLRQLDFLKSKNPGFNKENVVIVNAEGTKDSRKTLERFRNQLQGQPDISGISSAELSLGSDAGWSRSAFEYKGTHKDIFEYHVDPQYVPVLGLRLLAGRNFDYSAAADTQTSIIINEAAVRDFGWTPESAVGQILTGYDESDPSKNPVVIGVVQDYNYLSLHDQLKPMMFQMFSSYAPYQFYVRIAPGHPGTALESIRQAWAGSEPVLPFRYSFLDENLQKFYAADERRGRLVAYAGILAIALACLGLFGLSALAAGNRTKEIGVRKVLGASVGNLTGLLAKDFLKLVGVAIVIASPLAYYLMDRWLADFAYRINLGWWMFAAAGVLAISTAFLTVGYQAVKAAVSNPVHALRNE
jgi:putative ABC transport system permease protein